MPLIDLDAQVAQVLAVIRQAGGRPMLVGGCVRDALIAPGTPAKDIDVEVYGLPFGTLSEALAATEKENSARTFSSQASTAVSSGRSGSTPGALNASSASLSADLASLRSPAATLPGTGG